MPPKGKGKKKETTPQAVSIYKRNFQVQVDRKTQQLDNYALTRQAFNNPSASDREIVTTIIDFFDFDFQTEPALAYKQYIFYPNNVYGMATASPGAPNPLGRPLSHELWALPRFVNDSVGTAGVAVMFGVPVTAGSGLTASTCAQQTTFLTPTSVSDWVKVGEWNEKTVDLSTQQLLVAPDGGTAMSTFTVIDPDDSTLITSGNPIQFMAKTKVAQALPNLIDVKAGTFSGSATLWSAVPQTPGITASPVMVVADHITKTE